MSSSPSGLVPRESLVTVAHVIYALHAFSVLTGLATAALLVTAFLTGWASIIAVIINYVKRSEGRGTWVHPHLPRPIRMLWVLVAAVLFFTVIGIPFAWAIWVITGIWVLYRIIRGWLALASKRTLP